MIIGMSTLGDFVRERRKLVGYRTQEALAEKLGRDQAWVSRLERISETLPPDEMAIVAEALGVAQVELLEAAGYDVSARSGGDTEAVAAVRAILGNREFTDEEIAHLASIVQTMVSALKGRR